MKTYNDLFANNMKYYLNRRHLTQAELARRVCVSTATVSDWCNGNKLPGNMATYMKIASVFSVAVADLFDVTHNELSRRAAAYAAALAKNELLQMAADVLVKVPTEDLPRIIGMLKIFAREK